MVAGTTTSTHANAAPPAARSDPQEIAWMFVQQYYNTLSTEPTLLHRFYSKASTMLHGTDCEMVKACHGQEEIQTRIAELDFNGSTIIVVNVDALWSMYGSMMVVVLGEMQTHEQPSRKFIQTFVLAEQPSGFFVLNDVFRFLKEEYIGEAEYEAAVAAQQQQGQQTGVGGVSPVPQQQQQVPKQQPQQQHAPHQEMSYGKHPLAPSTAAPVASAPAAAPKSPVKPPQSQAPVVAKPVVTAAESKPVANTTAATTTAPVPVASKPVAAVSAATAALAATRPTASPTPKTWASLVVDAAAKPSTSEQPAKPTAATTSAPAASVVPAASSTAAMRPPSGKSGHGLNVAKAVFIRGTRAAKIPLLKEEFGKSIGAVRWIDLMTENTAALEFVDESSVAKALAMKKILVAGETIAIDVLRPMPEGGFGKSQQQQQRTGRGGSAAGERGGFGGGRRGGGNAGGNGRSSSSSRPGPAIAQK